MEQCIEFLPLGFVNKLNQLILILCETNNISCQAKTLLVVLTQYGTQTQPVQNEIVKN